MKLMEITPITADKLTPQKSPGREETITRLYKGGFEDPETLLGSGCFASAYATGQEPGSVRKIVQQVPNLDRDAYFQYVNMITHNNRMQSNRYFPKIFNIKVCKTPSNKQTQDGYMYDYAVDLERLHDWNSLKSREALMLGAQMFHNFERLIAEPRTHVPPQYIPDKNIKKDSKPYRELLMKLIRSTIQAGKGTKISNIKDPLLKQAIILIRNLKQTNQHGMFADIHDGNIMLRRAKHGPQIVFSDPVAG